MISRWGGISLRRWAMPAGASLLFVAGIASMRLTAPHASKNYQKLEFNRDIRPIISKCFTCHGSDPGARIMGLRLDLASGAETPLKDGKVAIVPYHPEKSEAIARIFSKDPNYMMPPPDSNKFLTDDERRILKQWIAEGAEYKEHWGFVEPIRYPLPKVEMKSWPKNDIDYFVLANLESHNLKPSPQADRYTLIRRVYLDLIGLPPTLDQINAFVNDKSPNAYEKVVDQLLASPRYGERMAMDWMDYSRYADSNGYQSDWERHQWRWRDWVIKSFNDNMPYDQFAIKQIAGDLLPHANMWDIVATGFERNHRINTEGGVIPEEWRIENVIDRVSTTAETFMGLTAGCARCHDHKFDPISQKDFYSLCAYFNNVSETGSGVEMPVNHPPLEMAPNKAQSKELNALNVSIVCDNSDLDDIRAIQGDPPADWQPKDEKTMASLSQGVIARYKLGGSPSLLDGKAPMPKNMGVVKEDAGRSTGAVQVGENGFVDLGKTNDFERNTPFSLGAWLEPNDGNGSAISKMDIADNFKGYDLFFDSGRPIFHIIHHWSDDAIKVLSTDTIPLNEWSHVFVTYDGSGKAAGVKIYINGKLTKQTVEVDALKGSIRNDVTAKLGRRTGGNFFNGKIDDPVFYNRALTSDEVAQLASVDPAIPILAIAPAKRTTDERRILQTYYLRETMPKFKALDDTRAKLEAQKEKLIGDIPTVMVMDDGHPRPAYLLVRGEYDHHGVEVHPAIPPRLGHLPAGAPNNRLGLAEWIASPKNPLFARVAVNRMWARLYGTGICATQDDFGTRAEYPSNPELLDWLATEFVRLKFDQKAMWKEMVMSAAYQQRSEATPAMVKNDPDDRLIERGPRFRMTAEMIRDQAMLFGNILVEKIGGPSVYPYQPKGIWDEMTVYGNLRNYKHAIGPDLHRRSLYTIWKRTSPPPNMTVFDAPSHEVCLIMRARTDTPMQALTLMNDVTFMEASRALAMRMIKEGGPTLDSRIAFAFKVVLSRLPTPQETAILKDGLAKRLAYYHANIKDAEELTSEGDLKNDPKLNVADIAAYTIAASTMLNLDETITIE